MNHGRFGHGVLYWPPGWAGLFCITSSVCAVFRVSRYVKPKL